MEYKFSGLKVKAFIFYVGSNGALRWQEKEIKMEQITFIIEVIFLFLFKLFEASHRNSRQGNWEGIPKNTQELKSEALRSV